MLGAGEASQKWQAPEAVGSLCPRGRLSATLSDVTLSAFSRGVTLFQSEQEQRLFANGAVILSHSVRLLHLHTSYEILLWEATDLIYDVFPYCRILEKIIIVNRGVAYIR